MTSREVNFDGIVGPTHNYAGLSFGNVASEKHQRLTSSPKKAALQGLEKMRALYDMGIPQAVLPPQERPHIPTLRKMGLEGSDQRIWEKAWSKIPEVAAGCCSASSMWVANAATISPSTDTADGKTHLTPANLSSMQHRAIEAPTTHQILQRIFSDSDLFTVHEPLAPGDTLGDEGAANHTRLCQQYGDPGVELFVYGVDNDHVEQGPEKYPARQTLQASEQIAKQHQCENKAVFAQQNPAVIDAGVFHNDVIAVGNLNVLFFHQHAFSNHEALLKKIQTGLGETDLVSICVADKQVSVADAVSSYLFNSQLIQVQDRVGQLLIAPTECRENSKVHRYLQELSSSESGISEVQYFDLRESMRNGGGPACLRLRVVLSEAEIDALGARVIFSPQLHQELTNWVESHYRDRLAPDDLRDPQLIDESRTALDELTEILNLGTPYEFQH